MEFQTHWMRWINTVNEKSTRNEQRRLRGFDKPKQNRCNNKYETRVCRGSEYDMGTQRCESIAMCVRKNICEVAKIGQ